MPPHKVHFVIVIRISIDWQRPRHFMMLINLMECTVMYPYMSGSNAAALRWPSGNSATQLTSAVPQSPPTKHNCGYNIILSIPRTSDPRRISVFYLCPWNKFKWMAPFAVCGLKRSMQWLTVIDIWSIRSRLKNPVPSHSVASLCDVHSVQPGPTNSRLATSTNPEIIRCVCGDNPTYADELSWT